MIPSCSRTRSRSESVRGLMPGQERSSSEKRRGPSDMSWTITAVHLAPMMSAVQATEQLASWTARIVRMRSLYSEASLVPRRRVVHPPSAGHRRDNAHVPKAVGRALEWVVVQDDKVCELTGYEAATPAFRSLEPGRGDARRMDGLFHRDALFRMPGRPVVDRAEDSGRDPCERVELLDRRVRSVGDVRAGVEERTVGVRAHGQIAPEAVGEVAVRGCVTELNGCRDAELREARHVLRREELGVLDAGPEPARAPVVLRRFERVERLPVRQVADCVDGDGEACARRPADDVLELGLAGDLDPRAVEHACRLGTERSVHEGLDVADLEERVSETGRDADLPEPVDVVVRQRLPDPQREGAVPLELLEDGQRPEPAVLVVDRDDAAG